MVIIHNPRPPTVCVVIPIHKVSYSLADLAGLRQIVGVLMERNIVVIHPNNIQASDIQELLGVRSNPINYIALPSKNFASISSYNNLLLSIPFYRLFGQYEYILISQPDAWIFTDTLDDFTCLGYDYIGAPWGGSDVPSFLCGRAGNGGLSLRRVSSHLKVLTSLRKFLPKAQKSIGLLSNFLDIKEVNNLYSLLGSIHRRTLCFYLEGKCDRYCNEDMIWSIVVPYFLKWFLVAPPSVAARFSIETDPHYFKDIIGGRPFGLHAWEKHGNDLWQPDLLGTCIDQSTFNLLAKLYP